VTFRPFTVAALALITAGLARAADISFKIADASDKPVLDAVVALYPLDAPMPAAERNPAVEIEQRDLEFHPFVSVLRVGSSATLPNREKKVEHHVYSSSEAKRFEFPLYKPGKAETVVFDKPGVVVLGCSIHDSMLAYVVVLDTAWFARTTADGTATFAGLPAGHWRAEIWHPRLPEAADKGLAVGEKRNLTLPETGGAPLQTVALKLEREKRIHRGPNIGGAGYK
jgi:plastocyanin